MKEENSKEYKNSKGKEQALSGGLRYSHWTKEHSRTEIQTSLERAWPWLPGQHRSYCGVFLSKNPEVPGECIVNLPWAVGGVGAFQWKLLDWHPEHRRLSIPWSLVNILSSARYPQLCSAMSLWKRCEKFSSLLKKNC